MNPKKTTTPQSTCFGTLEPLSVLPAHFLAALLDYAGPFLDIRLLSVTSTGFMDGMNGSYEGRGPLVLSGKTRTGLKV